MTIIIGLLTLVLVLSSLLLILLILMQLPKKEAGLGQAFGAGATDALFGAGSGNVLTKATKYCAGIFLVVALMLSVIGSHNRGGRQRMISEELMKRDATPATKTVPATAPETPQSPIQLQSAPTTPAPAAPAGSQPKADAPAAPAPATPATTPEKK